MTDPRSRIQRGDRLLRDERYAESVAEYIAAAEAYFAAGFALKAVAVFGQVVAIVDRSAPELAVARTQALLRLLQCYTTLGLALDAEETRRRLG